MGRITVQNKATVVMIREKNIYGIPQCLAKAETSSSSVLYSFIILIFNYFNVIFIEFCLF